MEVVVGVVIVVVVVGCADVKSGWVSHRTRATHTVGTNLLNESIAFWMLSHGSRPLIDPPQTEMTFGGVAA